MQQDNNKRSHSELIQDSLYLAHMSKPCSVSCIYIFKLLYLWHSKIINCGRKNAMKQIFHSSIWERKKIWRWRLSCSCKRIWIYRYCLITLTVANSKMCCFFYIRKSNIVFFENRCSITLYDENKLFTMNLISMAQCKTAVTAVC